MLRRHRFEFRVSEFGFARHASRVGFGNLVGWLVSIFVVGLSFSFGFGFGWVWLLFPVAFVEHDLNLSSILANRRVATHSNDSEFKWSSIEWIAVEQSGDECNGVKWS